MRLTMYEIEAMPLAKLRQLLLDQYGKDFDAEAEDEKHQKPNDRFWVQGLAMTFAMLLRRASARAGILQRLQEGAAEKPDFEHWARMPTWSANEVAALFAGLDPRKIRDVIDKVGDAAAGNVQARRFDEVQAILKRGHTQSYYSRELYLHPVDAINWARRFEVSVPPDLEEAVLRMWAEPEVGPDHPETPSVEKPIDERERITLLCIIGALAREQGIDLSQHIKAGDTVAAMAPELTLSGRTIGEKLRLVRDAMDRRTR